MKWVKSGLFGCDRVFPLKVYFLSKKTSFAFGFILAVIQHLHLQAHTHDSILSLSVCCLYTHMNKLTIHIHTRTHFLTDDMYTKPFAEYACLKIAHVIEDSNEDHHSPFFLRRLLSREYHIGPEGAVIGTSAECNICLPKEAGLMNKHVEIKWIPGNGDSTISMETINNFFSLDILVGDKFSVVCF